MLDSLKNKQSLLPCLVKPDNVADGNCNKNTHDVSGTNFKGTKTTISSVAMAKKKLVHLGMCSCSWNYSLF